MPYPSKFSGKAWWIYIKPNWYAFKKRYTDKSHRAYLEKLANYNGLFTNPIGAYKLPELYVSELVIKEGIEPHGLVTHIKQKISKFGQLKPIILKRTKLNSLNNRWQWDKSNPENKNNYNLNTAF